MLLQVRDFGGGLFEVSIDRSGGKSLGFKPMKDPATGKGMAVKSMEAGGLFEATGVAQVGTVLTHVNGNDVQGMALKEIGAIIKSQDTVTIKFQSFDTGMGTSPPFTVQQGGTIVRLCVLDRRYPGTGAVSL